MKDLSVSVCPGVSQACSGHGPGSVSVCPTLLEGDTGHALVVRGPHRDPISRNTPKSPRPKDLTPRGIAHDLLEAEHTHDGEHIPPLRNEYATRCQEGTFPEGSASFRAPRSIHADQNSPHAADLDVLSRTYEVRS